MARSDRECEKAATRALIAANLKEEMMNIITTLKAVAPILRNALKSGQLFNPQAELTEPHPDVLCEYDVKIPMSEGFSVTANIYRSKTAEEKGNSIDEVRSTARPVVASRIRATRAP